MVNDECKDCDKEGERTSEEYEDELVTSHSDENPELTGHRSGPLAAHTTEGSAVSELYKKERDPFHYQPRSGETVIDEEVYIPPEE